LLMLMLLWLLLRQLLSVDISYCCVLLGHDDAAAAAGSGGGEQLLVVRERLALHSRAGLAPKHAKQLLACGHAFASRQVHEVTLGVGILEAKHCPPAATAVVNCSV